MKRNIKNGIMIGIIILAIVGIFLTMNYAKNHTSNEIGMSGNPPSMANNNGTPPSMPENNSNSEQKNGDRMMPPLNDRQNRKDRNMPDITNGNESTNNNSNSQNTPPEMPGNGMTPPDMNSNSGASSSLSSTYYVVFGILSFIIASLVMYLIMSKMNKKSFRETFADTDKKIIDVLGVVILTGGLTFLSGVITNNYFLTNTNNMGMGGSNSSMPGNTSGSITYSANKEITSNESITSGTYTSSTADENVISASGEVKATLSNIEVTKTGDSDGGDNTSFYGTNSAILAKDGATLNIENVKVTTNATGANGVFSYGGSATTNNSNSDGTTINISDSIITTTKDNSGGIMTTGGGVMNATNLTVNTSGTSSAAIRSDRGGGTVTVNKGTYKTTGQGSPSIYSTADITVNDATLIATASEGVVIEGKNKVTLNNCELTDTNNKLNGQSTTYKNIFLYQSMSGDAASGNSEFTAKNSKITTNKGDSFYVTNTTATINLENNNIINNDSDGNFLRIQKDSWGNSGSNGGDVTLNMISQNAIGNIVVDSISTLKMVMKTNSYFEGIINGDNQVKSIELTLDSTSKIKLTGDSYVTSFTNADTTNSNIDFNGYKLYVNGKAIN